MLIIIDDFDPKRPRNLYWFQFGTCAGAKDTIYVWCSNFGDAEEMAVEYGLEHPETGVRSVFIESGSDEELELFQTAWLDLFGAAGDKDIQRRWQRAHAGEPVVPSLRAALVDLLSYSEERTALRHALVQTSADDDELTPWDEVPIIGGKSPWIEAVDVHSTLTWDDLREDGFYDDSNELHRLLLEYAERDLTRVEGGYLTHEMVAGEVVSPERYEAVFEESCRRWFEDGNDCPDCYSGVIEVTSDGAVRCIQAARHYEGAAAEQACRRQWAPARSVTED